MPAVPVHLAAAPIPGGSSLLGIIPTLVLLGTGALLIARRAGSRRGSGFLKKPSQRFSPGNTYGHLRATASPPSWSPPQSEPSHSGRAYAEPAQADAPEPAKAPPSQRDELMALWDGLKSLAPKNSESPVTYLAKQSKLPQSMIEHIRDVRNKCAHPMQLGKG